MFKNIQLEYVDTVVDEAIATLKDHDQNYERMCEDFRNIFLRKKTQHYFEAMNFNTKNFDRKA